MQRTVRSCTGCGLCCTDAYNQVQVLPVEGRRIADWIARQPKRVRADLERRLRDTIARYGLRRGRERKPYTCAFLEADMQCALPISVKPVACLSFNPLTPVDCDQEPGWYHPVHDELLRASRADGTSTRRAPIPVAVVDALGSPRPSGTAG